MFQNLQKLLGFAPSRAMNRQSQSAGLFGVPSQQSGQYSYFRWYHSSSQTHIPINVKLVQCRSKFRVRQYINTDPDKLNEVGYFSYLLLSSNDTVGLINLRFRILIYTTEQMHKLLQNRSKHWLLCFVVSYICTIFFNHFTARRNC